MYVSVNLSVYVCVCVCHSFCAIFGVCDLLGCSHLLTAIRFITFILLAFVAMACTVVQLPFVKGCSFLTTVRVRLTCCSVASHSSSCCRSRVGAFISHLSTINNSNHLRNLPSVQWSVHQYKCTLLYIHRHSL